MKSELFKISATLLLLLVQLNSFLDAQSPPPNLPPNSAKDFGTKEDMADIEYALLNAVSFIFHIIILLHHYKIYIRFCISTYITILFSHIQHHLEGEVDVKNMQKDQLQKKFLYFKAHDLNNDLLIDGLELMKDLLHVVEVDNRCKTTSTLHYVTCLFVYSFSRHCS